MGLVLVEAVLPNLDILFIFKEFYNKEDVKGGSHRSIRIELRL